MKKRSAEHLATQPLRNEKGASMVEYALLAALIAVGAMGSVSSLGIKGRDTFKEVEHALAAGGFETPDEPVVPF